MITRNDYQSADWLYISDIELEALAKANRLKKSRPEATDKDVEWNYYSDGAEYEKYKYAVAVKRTCLKRCKTTQKIKDVLFKGDGYYSLRKEDTNHHWQFTPSVALQRINDLAWEGGHDEETMGHPAMINMLNTAKTGDDQWINGVDGRWQLSWHGKRPFLAKELLYPQSLVIDDIIKQTAVNIHHLENVAIVQFETEGLAEVINEVNDLLCQAEHILRLVFKWPKGMQDGSS